MQSCTLHNLFPGPKRYYLHSPVKLRLGLSNLSSRTSSPVHLLLKSKVPAWLCVGVTTEIQGACLAVLVSLLKDKVPAWLCVGVTTEGQGAPL